MVLRLQAHGIECSPFDALLEGFIDTRVLQRLRNSHITHVLMLQLRCWARLPHASLVEHAGLKLFLSRRDPKQ